MGDRQLPAKLQTTMPQASDLRGLQAAWTRKACSVIREVFLVFAMFRTQALPLPWLEVPLPLSILRHLVVSVRQSQVRQVLMAVQAKLSTETSVPAILAGMTQEERAPGSTWAGLLNALAAIVAADSASVLLVRSALTGSHANTICRSWPGWKSMYQYITATGSSLQ